MLSDAVHLQLKDRYAQFYMHVPLGVARGERGRPRAPIGQQQKIERVKKSQNGNVSCGCSWEFESLERGSKMKGGSLVTDRVTLAIHRVTGLQR